MAKTTAVCKGTKVPAVLPLFPDPVPVKVVQQIPTINWDDIFSAVSVLYPQRLDAITYEVTLLPGEVVVVYLSVPPGMVCIFNRAHESGDRSVYYEVNIDALGDNTFGIPPKYSHGHPVVFTGQNVARKELLITTYNYDLVNSADFGLYAPFLYYNIHEWEQKLLPLLKRIARSQLGLETLE